MDKFWVHLAQLFWEVRSTCSSQNEKYGAGASYIPGTPRTSPPATVIPHYKIQTLILHTNLSASSAYQSFSCVSKIPILLCALCAFLVLFAVKYYS